MFLAFLVGLTGGLAAQDTIYMAYKKNKSTPHQGTRVNTTLKLDVSEGEGIIVVEWSDGVVSEYPF